MGERRKLGRLMRLGSIVIVAAAGPQTIIVDIHQ